MNLQAYNLIEKRTLADLNATGYIYKHKKSGAKICLISNDDENKVFTVGFRTPPSDDTGVPHITEHSVLCGSRKFKAKDPFIELVKGSLNTFLNAITYADKTIYPVASCNEKDFQNLMDVYMDAVFYPKIYDREEIFQQEGWHYELESPEDELTINGVVYNEMKGAYSSSEEVLTREIYRTLFPNTTYSKDSGGDPATIPSLTYQDFLDFHSTYYHPSNSYIYLYGDMDMEEKLNWLDTEYLSKFEYLEMDTTIKLQQPFTEMKRQVSEYSIAQGEEETENTYLSYSAVISTSLDKELYLAFDVLDYALISAPGAPLRKALLDAGIGKDIMGSFDNGTYQTVFSIAVQNAEAEQENEFLNIIRSVLEDQVKHGISEKALMAAINSDEFKFREADYGNFPKGLLWGIQTFDSWLYDENEPFMHLEAISTYDFLRKQIGTGYYENLISTYLLQNPHSAVVILKPKKGLNQEADEKLQQKLAAYKETLSEPELQKIIEQTKHLKDYQDEPSTQEELETIPMLSRQDMKKEAAPFINEELDVDGTKVLLHEMFTSGITYTKFLFDVKDIPEELIPYMGMFKAVFSYVDTQHFPYDELTNEIDLRTGGMSSRIGIYGDTKTEGAFQVKFEVTMKTFEQKLPEAFELLSEMILTSRLDDTKRIKEILSQLKSRLQNAMSASGHQVGAMRAMSYYSQTAQWNDRLSGIYYYQTVSEVVKQFDEDSMKVVENLKKVRDYIFRTDRMLVSVTASKDGFAIMRGCLPTFVKEIQTGMPTKPLEEHTKPLLCEKKNEGLKDASQVQYVVCAGNFRKKGFAYTGLLRTLKCILNFDYLWNNIRVKGGAYGCGSAFGRSGDSYFSSYRDPNLSKTFEVYAKVPEYVRSFDADERDMTKYIIGTINEMDTPLNPSAKGNRSLTAYLTNLTFEEIQKEREEIIQASVSDIRALADLVQAVVDADYRCVIGNEQMIEKEQDLFLQIENLY